MDEFALIDRIVAILGERAKGEGVLLGPGDDAALVAVPSGFDLAVTTDTLVAGRHFPTDASGDLVGARAMGVNLSDLAAMGAEARYCVVALTAPEPNIPWIEAFARGLAEAAARHGVAVVGGNLARGPLSVSVAAHGIVPRGEALVRSGARPGDRVYLSGALGVGYAARLAGDPRFYRVEPRLALGVSLRGIASAALDISDGFLSDLGHLCTASAVGAEVDLESVPVCPDVDARTALSCGDDYELLFTASAPTPVAESVHPVGRIVVGEGVTLFDAGRPVALDPNHPAGFRHFE
ncbi:MAG: thiamine-phosphate kinase [Gammaproteobacteria bacterium]|nr:thiamine-phosphate kinase [Gammaproteobacteria bacterium]